MSAALFAGLYLVGLLIVNINLAQYDLVTLDLARSEYILTGTLWAFFAGLTYVAYHEARRALEHTTAPPAAAPMDVDVDGLVILLLGCLGTALKVAATTPYAKG